MVLKTGLCRFSGAKIYPGNVSDWSIHTLESSFCPTQSASAISATISSLLSLYGLPCTGSSRRTYTDIRVEAAKKRHRTTKSPCGLAVNRLWTRH
ncbi:60S ribosomal protein L24 isoform X2 [Triticum aestivum]|uniref:60S ribosomal protein L24 isoform X2 n=1 Tax=Triticum aestivum TaxID=4565 RepID=UPI001D013B2E|nr:60S ribosomal protein L24-like isoform X2 [Triticum aestivum]